MRISCGMCVMGGAMVICMLIIGNLISMYSDRIMGIAGVSGIGSVGGVVWCL